MHLDLVLDLDLCLSSTLLSTPAFIHGSLLGYHVQVAADGRVTATASDGSIVSTTAPAAGGIGAASATLVGQVNECVKCECVRDV